MTTERATGMTDEEHKTARQAEIEDQMTDILTWWEGRDKLKREQTAPKAVEYGAADLDIMATAMVALAGEKLDGATDTEKMQWGRYAAASFYALGKAARIFGALERGVLPNADSEFDLGVYSDMMGRIRDTGRWV